MNKKIIICVIIVGIICFGVGFLAGMNVTVNKGIHLVQVLMSDNHLNVTYDQEILKSLIRRYASSSLT